MSHKAQSTTRTADAQAALHRRDNMWRSMKMLSNFIVKELSLSASTEEVIVSIAEATKYCNSLQDAGYLLCIGSSTGVDKRRYKLLPRKNTGPHAPIVARVSVVFDANTKAIVWHEAIQP